MPLQNRVTPFGEIVAVPERGTLVGNRGVLHDEQRRLVRTSQLRRWICCVLAWKGVRRTVMTPRRWTELFFLDEATAFAAGHRPCFECRRSSALAFQAAWKEAISPRARADEMDRVMASERRMRGGEKRTWTVSSAALRGLPDGAFVAIDGAAWLVRDGTRARWSAAGYRDVRDLGDAPESVEVLTPPSIVGVLRAGYPVTVHPSTSARGA